MSSGAGEAGGAGGLDLNFDAGAVLDDHEAGAADEVEDAPVSICGEFVERERGESMDVGGDEKNECVRGIADREDGMMGNGEGSAASGLEARPDVGVVGNVIREAEAESHGGKLLEVEFVEKGCAEPISVSTVGFEDVVAGNQTMNLGDGSGDNQKRGAAVDMEGVMGTDEISSTVLVGGGRTGDERLEGSAILRREQVEVRVDLVDGGGELADGQLDLEERVPDAESFTVKLIEVDTGEKEITDPVTFVAVDTGNQAARLGNVSGDQKQGIDVNVEGLVIDHHLGSGEREAEVVSHGRKFLEVEKREEGSSELAVVSTEGFEPAKASITTLDFHDGSGGDQKQGTDLVAELDLGEKGSADLVAVSTVGFEAVEASSQAMYLGDGFDNDQNQISDENKKKMVRTDEGLLTVLVCAGLAVDEKLEGSSNLREEQADVDLVDAGVQAVDDQLSPEEREAEGDSLHMKLLEMDIGGRESADLVSVSAEVCKAVDVSNQAVGSETTNLVAVSAQLIEAVEASNLAVNLGDGFIGDQKQGIDLDAEGVVMDGQLDPAESDAEVKPLSGKFLKMDKGGEGSAVLVSVLDEDFQPVEASRNPMNFHDGSGGDQKRGTEINEEGMVIDGELGSGKRKGEVETPEEKPLEMEMVKKGSTVLVSISTERLEQHAKVCSQAKDLSYGSGDDQRRGAGFNVESIARINEDSIPISVGSGGKLLEDVYSEKRIADPVAVSSKVFEPVEASSHAINLVHRSGDDQRLAVGVDAEGVVRINETSGTCTGGPEDERSEPSFILRKKQVVVWDDLGDERDQPVHGELDTRKREAEFKSYGGSRCIEVNMGEKVSAKLLGASSELPETVGASSEAMNLGDGAGGDPEQSVDVDMEGLMGTDGGSLTVLVVGKGVDNEKMEGSSTLRMEQFEIQVDESDRVVGAQLGCGESKAEVDSHEGMLLELHTGEKEGADLVAASAEDFDAVEASNQAMNSGDGSGDDQIQGIDAGAEGMNQDVQLGPAERDAELNSISRKLSEVDQSEKESAEPVAVSSATFERVETSGQAMDFGDGSDGDQKGGTDVNVEGMALDAESSPGKSVAEVESHGEKFLEVDRDDEGITELPTLSTEGFLNWKANSDPMNLIDGYGGNQRLETDVDAESIVRTDEDPASISLASGAAPEDARLEEILISRKEDSEFQDNLVDGINEVVECELGTAISLPEVQSYGERCMDVDMGEKGSTKLVVASTERSEAVVSGSHAMNLGSGSGSDHIQRTDGDAEDMARNADSVTVLIVGGTLGNASLEGSLPSGKEQVEVLVQLVDGCGQIENELESHDRMLLEVDLEEKRKDLIAASAVSSEAVEVSCQAMNLGDRSGVDQVQGIDVNTEDNVDICDDSAAVSAGGEGPQDERLEDESTVLGIEHGEALQKLVDGCGQAVDIELIHRERTPIVDSHGGKLLKVETVAKEAAEPFAISAEGFEAVEACSQVMDLEHGSDDGQKQGTDVNAEYEVGTSGDYANVSSAIGAPEDDLERSLLLENEHTEVLQDIVDGHNQVFDGELGPGKRKAEVEPYSEMFLELLVRQKGSTELVSVAAGGSVTAEPSSQVMDLEDGYSSEQKQESDVGAVCVLKTDEYSVVASIDCREPKDEMLNGSSNLIKEVEFGGATHGTRSSAKDLPESTKNEIAGYDPIIHAAQHQTEFDGGRRQDTDVGAETMVGGTEQVSLAVSVSGGGPEDDRLETSYEFREKHDDVGEDNIRPETPDTKLAHPENIGGNNADAMKDTGHVKELLHSKHREDLGSREEFGGDHRIGSCMESDAEPLDFTVACQGVEAQGLEAAPRSDGKQVKVKCGDESHMVDKVAHFQDSVDRVNLYVVCDLAEGHPDEMEDEIIRDSGHNLSQVNSEVPAGVEIMIKKDLACLPVVEVDHSIMHCALDDQVPGNEVYNHETVAADKKQDNGLESFQGSGLVLIGGEAGIVHHSPVGTERVEVFTQASSVENDSKIFNENNAAAGETVQKLDSIPIIEEQDTALRQVDTVVSGNIVECSDVPMTAMVLHMPVNVEAWSSDEHAAVDNMVDKGNVLYEDNGPVMNVASAEFQNGDARLNFDHQIQKIDSSSLMVSCREEEAHASGSHLHSNVFMEKGYSIMEDSNSLLGISIPDSSAESAELSVGCQDVRPLNVPPKEHEEVEPVQGTLPALHTEDKTINCSLKMQDGTPENLKESENQGEGCDDTRADSASTSQRATYYLCFPEEGFYTSDLVWGKVKSHPWWPGQIFDFSGASQLAIKYQKKDHFLVAYFGDKTFAWCEESRLKPFQLFYSQMEKQTSSDSFLHALCDILAEISRRVELSMICSCLPEETYADIKYQKVENAGVQGKIVDSVFDRCEIVNYFHPDQFLEYVRALAQLPFGGADRLELAVVQAQLKAFYLSRGYTELPAFTNGSGLVEYDFETPMSKKLNDDDLDHSATLSDLFSTKGKLKSRDGSLGNQKQIVEDGRKQKSLSELMEEKTTFLLVNRHENASEVQEDENCVSSGNKRKAFDYVSTDIGRSKTKKVDSQVDEETKLPSPTSNSSFKVGAFISRAASKLTSGQPIRKCHSETSERGLSKTDDWSVDYMDLDDFFDVPFEYPKLQIDLSVDYPPTNEMLYKLCLAARNPLKGHNFSSTVINFFCIFRNVQVSNTSIEKNKTEKPRAKRGRKKKIILDLVSPDMSTPDHMKDSYWSDMIIPEKDAPLNPPKRRGRKKRKFTEESSPSSLILNSPSDCEPKLHTGAICPHVKHLLTAERPIISVEEKIIDERTPTAVILYFNSSNSLPSDLDLIRIFSRYGPLKEEETFIERKNNSAMVVFKKRTDAEMAFSGAGNFSTFGPALLSYRLRHFPSKSSPVNPFIGEDDATLINDGPLRISAEPEFNGASDGNLCEAVSKESSFFVQSQGHFGTVPEMPTGEFSELAQYQVGDVVVSDSAPTNTGSEEPFQDVPAPMETGAAADHLLLESLDQEFSYFDLDHAEAGDISGTEVGTEKSHGLLLETTEVSFSVNDRSLREESCNPATAGETAKQVAATGTSESVAEQLENGTLLETGIQVDAVDIPDKFNVAPDQPGEKECSDSPAPGHTGAGTSDQSSVTIDAQLMEADSNAVEVREATTLSDSTQIALEGRDPSAEAPIHVTELCISEQRIS
ncbi:uncharacterized protein LOC110024130 isoform X2 [Phalaenopsis equestris]|uniref:uncharacterized protein LOC110024130 isoform X2 n=1 Tax=Phalaenopsis equestris TaxID=78828 RepID=UPI0009E5FCC7|nr:uncharacterized protein LOC110024130 isoform X2 [Phalaenopsis equestris]